MTLEELAEELGIGMTKAYAMARANTLPIPTLKVGREFRFSRVAYDRLVNAGHGERVDSAA
jgi:excisionase family DNA binding protein